LWAVMRTVRSTVGRQEMKLDRGGRKVTGLREPLGVFESDTGRMGL
jgi:hypothetical protein